VKYFSGNEYLDHTDFNLGEVAYVSIIFHIPLNFLDGYLFLMALHCKPAIDDSMSYRRFSRRYGLKRQTGEYFPFLSYDKACGKFKPALGP